MTPPDIDWCSLLETHLRTAAVRRRRGFTIPPGARVLMVEDIITTGLSSRETLEALAEHPGTIVGAACLIDRSGARLKSA